jgi:Domain of unknown function (DUF4728)
LIPERIHAEIYFLLSIFGFFCSVLLIIGTKKKSSGNIIWWICFQGISIFHQIYFSVDVFLIIRHELISKHSMAILVVISISFLIYLIIEIYFMLFIVNLYQDIQEYEIENSPRSSRTPSYEPTNNYYTRRAMREVTERNNPMQSSIIALLNELEGNNTLADASLLIRST